MFVLDTDVVSHLRKRNPDPRLRAWLGPIDASRLHIASFTVAELHHGLALAQRDARSNAAELAVWVPDVIAASSVLNLDAEIGALLGSLWAEPALHNLFMTSPSARKIKTSADLVIAATALRHSATVVTGNFADFALIAQHCTGLRVFNPFTGQSVPPAPA